jgi:hypothetical protein
MKNLILSVCVCFVFFSGIASSKIFDRNGRVIYDCRDTIKKDSIIYETNRFLNKDSLALFPNDYEIVLDYVKTKISPWLVKDKFETSVEFGQRTSFENRKRKEEGYSSEAIRMVAPVKIDAGKAELDLNSYDADNETYTIKIPNTENILVKVNRADAPAFEQNWNSKQITNVRYAIYNKRFVITKADVIVNYKTYRFTASQTTTWGRMVQNFVYTNEIQSQIPTPYAEVIRYVKDKMAKYQVQDEFELPEAYQKRTSHEELAKVEAKFSSEIISQAAAKTIKFDNLNLGKYNPRNQTFPIQLQNSVDLNLPVTIAHAPKFKESWKFYEFRDVTYALFQNQFIVAKANIMVGDSLYSYNVSNDPAMASSVLYAVDLDSINNNWLDDKTFAMLYGEKKSSDLPSISFTDVIYSDADGNGQIDAGEKGELKISLRNTGKGKALKMKLEVVEKNRLKGVDFRRQADLGNMDPEQGMQVVLPLEADGSVENGNLELTIKVTEALNNNPPDKTFSLKVNRFKAPKVLIDNFYFATATGEPLKLGETANCKILIQNFGEGSARNVTVKVAYPSTVIPSGKSEFSFTNINPGQIENINFEFLVNKQHAEQEVKLELIVKEGSGNVAFGDAKSAKVNFKDQLTPFTQYAMVSEVDRNIPNDTVVKKNTFALIIGNEDYRTEAGVVYAAADAIMFKRYAEQCLGIPAANIKFKVNAEKYQMEKMIDDIVGYIKTNNDTSDLIVFYAGHGFPQEVTNEPYIMPVDVKGSEVTNGIKLSTFYEKLTSAPNVRNVIVFIDACFSGGGREQGLLAARAVKVKPKEQQMQKGNLVVFSASSGEQVALPYKDKNHGMFSYHLLKKIQEAKGSMTLGELADFIKINVESQSKRVNEKDQSPKVNISPGADGLWDKWKLK